MSQIFLLGISHRTASIELRERLDFSEQELPKATTALLKRPSVNAVVVLSTCNRSELYVHCTNPKDAQRDLFDFLCEFKEISPDELQPIFYALAGTEAVQHLFRVSAGLDSLVVGEPQIFGQVKQAFAAAEKLHATNSVLNRLFNLSFVAGKRVRSETELGEGAVSISYAAVALARKIFGKLEKLSVLLIGTGEMAQLTGLHFKAQQVQKIFVASRTPAHAEALATEIEGEAIPWSQIDTVLASTDVVATATGANKPLLTKSQIDAVMRERQNRPLFFIDIAVPRNVEPDVGFIEQVFLYNIDDLQMIVDNNLSKRNSQIEKSEVIVEDTVILFTNWLRSRDAVPTVVALRQSFEDIRRAELERLKPKLASLSAADRARVEEISRLLIEKILLTPTEQLKAISDKATLAAYSDALEHLFELDPQTDQSAKSESNSPTTTSPKTPVTS
mgnify:FL=1